MKIKVKDIKGKLISINPTPYHYKTYEIVMEYECINLTFKEVSEDDITVIMENKGGN